MAEEVIEGVNPTRMELLGIRKKKKLAEKGHKLLSEKRDALVMQFFDIIKTRNTLRVEVTSVLQKAYQILIEAEMVMGQNKVRQVSYSIPSMGDIPTSEVNIMGVRVPEIHSEVIKTLETPPYGFIETTGKLDMATDRFRELVNKLLKLAEVEGAIERLAGEIEKTKRRVNALEHIVVPKLKATEKYIEMQLQEREREDFFRRKRIKALMERQEAAAAAS